MEKEIYPDIWIARIDYPEHCYDYLTKNNGFKIILETDDIWVPNEMIHPGFRDKK